MITQEMEVLLECLRFSMHNEAWFSKLRPHCIYFYYPEVSIYEI